MFRVEIETKNQAFTEDPGREIARALSKVIEKLNYGAVHGWVMDYNGNKVGFWGLDERTVEDEYLS